MTSAETKQHYESVKSFLIWAVGIACTVILLFGGWVTFLTFKDRAEMRAEYQSDIDRYKESMAQMRAEATANQKDILERVEREVSFLKEISKDQLDNISSETRQSAKEQTEKEISDIFKSDKIQTIIEKNAIGELKDKLPATIAEYTKRLPKILEAANFMRGGAPEGVALLKSYFTSTSEFERAQSLSTYQDIYNDYYKEYVDVKQDQYISKFKTLNVTVSAIHPIKENLFPKEKADIDNLILLMKIINDSDVGPSYMLYERALAMKALSFISGKPFTPFETADMNIWYKGLRK
ncbi:hypothetical protein EWM62_11285 [Mucilaginibacter terrigena]|uniref:Uncharacterized protein n=1 Tax=Mucilaginibacter terrigena TaxID=2492395 RepID=A0A4Q5LKK2_9SPHI|nr:hypothetical protein [Mucilaginibacter terrigena]RYU90118.1 hypothetical protein EWM62_11285 [Mucilaginibacter terrigena]